MSINWPFWLNILKVVLSCACRDIGMECDFEARAESERDLLKQVRTHAREAHSMRSIDAATMTRIRAAVRDE